MRFAKNKSFPHKRSLVVMVGCVALLEEIIYGIAKFEIHSSDAHLRFQVMCLVININDDTDNILTES